MRNWKRILDWAIISGLSLLIVATLVHAATLLPAAAHVQAQIVH
jgi:hypothetical protein